ncbi:protein kintoun-like [Mizuhopecten yessoensis]|uniref:Protein kintoun n=1 Tax=Mizuhopecten yessoensis TaxID=6573 RepID=A0A210PKS0_MIZYE|nr:protein kintoun-like [Mizuhopecten yessoensis]OWF37090.1 Protein kintoun [Mizuhopecten yessoensis]
MASRSKKFEDLNLSNDEVKKLGEALKNEEFRKLFAEYAEEISDPENRKRYEAEIQQLENEKGMDVQFIHPTPGHVLKTSIDGNKKAFINICHSDKIQKPVSQPQVDSDGRRGINWQIPHSHVPPRDDVDKSKQKCRVFDVVFHPDTYRMADNDRFRKLVEDTAIDGIESQFGCKVDRTNLKRMSNIKFKGTPTASIIRSRTKEGPKIGKDDILNSMPYPYSDQTSKEKAEKMAKDVKEKKKTSKTVKFDDSEEPKYTILHRSDLDLQEYRNSPDSRPSTRPKELEITIFLPLLSSAKEVDLDVFEQKLTLKSENPAKYKLDLKLPYPVDDDQGRAKFDKMKKCLVVTLPVIPDKVPEMPQFDGVTTINGVADGVEDSEGLVAPLIQEISSNEIPTESSAETNGDEPPPLEELTDTVVETSNLIESEAAKSSTAQAKVMDISYSCPEFTFNQDQGAVTYILAVRNVKVENISKSYSSKNMLHLTLVSIGDGGFPLHYSFCVKFAEDHTFVPEHCSVDVSDMNVVVLLLKERSCRGIWDAFLAGSSKDNLQEYLFMTESNLQRELAELEAEAALQKQDQHAAMQDAPVIQVTDMTQKRLQINIKKSGSTEEAEDGDIEEVPSSAEIQVVHEKEPPNLHSILKNRSMSESSECDGYGSSNSSGSPTSPRDEPFGLRRSVSFNERVDKTTFKPGTAVTSMTSTLKNKRKRNRKREEKRQLRLRNNSGGSEGSSGDDLDHRSSTGESHSENDEEGDESIAPPIDEKIEELEESIVPPNSETEKCRAPVVSSMPEEKPSREAQLVQNIKEKLLRVEEAGVKDEDSDDDGENIEGGVSSRTNTEQHKVVDVIEREGVNDNHERTKSADNKKVQGVCVQEDVLSVSGDKEQQQQAANQGGPTHQAATSQKDPADVTISPGDVITRAGVQDLLGTEQSVIKVTGEERGSGDDSGVESNTEGGGESSPADNQVETILSWKDPPSSEHATKCSFEFSNAVMFDLDVD